MTSHNYISQLITNFLDNIYFSKIQKIYNEDLSNVFKYCKFPVIKPEYFIFSQYYFIYLFLYYFNIREKILCTLSLHSIHVCSLIFDNLLIKYNYIPQNNIISLKENSYFLFTYLFYIKLIFNNIFLYKKIVLCTSIFTFYLLYKINEIYKERLNCIETKEEFRHPLKILVITPNKKIIEKIVNNTNYFTYSKYLFFINFLIWIFI